MAATSSRKSFHLPPLPLEDLDASILLVKNKELVAANAALLKKIEILTSVLHKKNQEIESLKKLSSSEVKSPNIRRVAKDSNNLDESSIKIVLTKSITQPNRV